MPEVNIERLSLHLSGISEDDGRHLARLIADGLASASLPESIGSKDEVTSNIMLQPGSNMRLLADQIVSDLVRQLNRTL